MIVRWKRSSVSRNVRRKGLSIARRAVHHCALLHIQGVRERPCALQQGRGRWRRRLQLSAPLFAGAALTRRDDRAKYRPTISRLLARMSSRGTGDSQSP